MECPFCMAKENTQFRFILGADDPQGKPSPYAYNVYQCECDAICRENVWENKGWFWVHPVKNETIFVKK